MTKPDPAELARRMLAAAREATPEEWYQDEIDRHVIRPIDAFVNRRYASDENCKNAAHIALCSPANVTALAEAYLAAVESNPDFLSWLAEYNLRVELQSRIDRALALLDDVSASIELAESAAGKTMVLVGEDRIESIRVALTGADHD